MLHVYRWYSYWQTLIPRRKADQFDPNRILAMQQALFINATSPLSFISSWEKQKREFFARFAQKIPAFCASKGEGRKT